MSARSRLVVLGALVAAFALGPAIAQAPAAPALQVQDGTLSVAQAPGDQTNVALSADRAGPPGDLLASRPRFVANPFSPASRTWPGSPPTAGAGCEPPSATQRAVRCPGVTAADVHLGAGADYFEIAGVDGPVRISGGAGRDGLVAQFQPTATLDGGEGDDVLRLFSGTALGGPGDDTIFLSSGTGGRHGSATVNCGTGRDHLQYVLWNAKPLPWRINAASCPPVVMPLMKRPTGQGARLPVVRPTAKRQIRIPLLRASETVRGTFRTVRFNRPGTCAARQSFRAAARKSVSVRLTINVAVVRRAESLSGHKGVLCVIEITGTDSSGEPFGGADQIQDNEFAAFFIVGRRCAACPCRPGRLQPG